MTDAWLRAFDTEALAVGDQAFVERVARNIGSAIKGLCGMEGCGPRRSSMEVHALDLGRDEKTLRLLAEEKNRRSNGSPWI
jgi:hypothetical protein